MDETKLLPRNNHIRSWEDLDRLLEYFSIQREHDWLFRGINDGRHELIPKIGRPDLREILSNRKDGTRPKHLPYNLKHELGLMKMFFNYARPHLGPMPRSPLEWLGIAQHHGMPTRLLDWTEGLLTAAWFAVSNVARVPVEEGGERQESWSTPVIWAIRNLPPVTGAIEENPYKVDRARSYRPPHISGRIAAQRSVFTIQPNPTRPLPVRGALKFTVDSDPNVWFTIKKRLDGAGINEMTLFPDLVGVSRYLGWRYENNWLAGYAERE
jgi:hypothetical protein